MEIKIKPEAYSKMLAYASAASDLFGNAEIGGWGFFDEESKTVTDVSIMEQEVSSVTFDAISFPIPENIEEIKKMKIVWHSHVNMGVNPSLVDISNEEKLAKNMPYIISIIINLKGEISARLIKYVDFLNEKLKLERKLDVVIYGDELLSEVKKKCRSFTPLNNYDDDVYDYKNFYKKYYRK